VKTQLRKRDNWKSFHPTPLPFLASPQPLVAHFFFFFFFFFLFFFYFFFTDGWSLPPPLPRATT
jgi:hypothetical protein